MNFKKDNFIKKYSGKFEKFSEDKIKKSLSISGFVPKETDDIASEVKKQIETVDLSTEEVFNRTKEIVFKKSHIAGYKYSLKHAIRELGPGGFIFERFIAQILRAEGYDVQVDLMMEGYCVQHEIDVKASNANHTLLAECKFHNAQDKINDLKVALYIKARMDDLLLNKVNQFNEFYLISNTAFSKEAIKYSMCANVKLLGFNYPIKRNLYQMIEENKYYPITCIPWLKRKDKEELLVNNIILIHELYENLSYLKKFGYHDNEIQIFKETYEKHLSRSK